METRRVDFFYIKDVKKVVQPLAPYLIFFLFSRTIMRSILYIVTFLFALAASPILAAPTSPEATVDQQEVQEQQVPQVEQGYHL